MQSVSKKLKGQQYLKLPIYRLDINPQSLNYLFSMQHMVQLPDIERVTWARLLIATYLAAHFVVTLLKVVQSICIIALVMLCVWDQVLVSFSSRWKHRKFEKSNNLECGSNLDPLTPTSMNTNLEKARA